jgi:tripartite-type tricarboxylate transporter receptor subunit TctC
LEEITVKIARQVILGSAIALAAFGLASAQDWPTRSVTVVVPIPAGVASDLIARTVFEQVGKQVGQTFVIENRPGAGGTIGANMVAKAAPDGHTILVYGSIAAANALYARLPYDTVADFTPGPGGDVAVIVGTPGLTSFAQVQAAMTDVGVYTVISLSATDQLYLYNVDPGQLTVDNFLFL